MLMENQFDFDFELIEDIQGRMILHWNYRNLRELPVEVLNYGEHIEEIYLKRNCLEKLPRDIGKLCNLTNLYLVGNQLEELPSEIGDLKCLRVLDVSNNYIRRLPSTVGELCLLESLLLTYNQLEELPRCLKKLHRLKQLELSGNHRIYSLPEEVIQGLESLEEFSVDRCPISSIPRNISMLRHLRYFSACRCNLLLLPSVPFHLLLHNNRTLNKRSNSVGGLNYNKNLQFLFDGNPRLNYVPYWVLQLLGTNVECFGCGLEPGESDQDPNSQHANSSTGGAQTQLQLYIHRGNVNRQKIRINFKGKRRTFHFDEDLVKLHNCGFNRLAPEGGAEMEGQEKVAVASLLELCLRQIFHLGLLEEAISDKSQGAMKPVVEPLIVPQRVVAGKSLINLSLGCQHFYKQDDFKKVEPNQGKIETAEKPQSSTKEADCSSSDAEMDVILPANLTRILQTGPVAKCFECLKPIFTEAWPVIFHAPRRSFDDNHGEPQAADGQDNDQDDNHGANENIIRGDWDDRLDGGKLSIGCAHFCSAKCVRKFRNSGKFSSNLPMNNLRAIIENEIPWMLV